MSGSVSTRRSRLWHPGAASRPVAVATAVEETIGSSQWELELRPYAHHAPLIAALDELARHAGGANPFFESEFLSASVDRIGVPGKNLFVLWEHIGETSLARLAFPVIEDRIGLPGQPVLRAWSHPYAPLSTPLIDMRDAQEACARFARLLCRLQPTAALPLVFDDFPADEPGSKIIARAMREAGYVVRSTAPRSRACLLPAGGMPVQAHLPILASAKRRRELARQLRKLEQLGRVEFEETTDFDHVVLRFEEFLLLETRGWKGRKGTSIHVLRKTASFARQAVAALGDRDRATIHSLRLDGRAIASLIMLRSGNRYFPWKIAFDPAYQSHSPGVHLMVHASTGLLGTGSFAGADSLAAERSWIDRVWPGRLALETLVVAPPDTPAAARAPAVARAVERELRLRRLARGLLRRNLPAPRAPRQSPGRGTPAG
ncbi:MAG: GNAT family N-acetyltransferase [Pseudomonadota bacterium]|nr:GNAT family N-acetyltransferase [Pseudomonadota bacterium]